PRKGNASRTGWWRVGSLIVVACRLYPRRSRKKWNVRRGARAPSIEPRSHLDGVATPGARPAPRAAVPDKGHLVRVFGFCDLADSANVNQVRVGPSTIRLRQGYGGGQVQLSTIQPSTIQHQH